MQAGYKTRRRLISLFLLSFLLISSPQLQPRSIVYFSPDDHPTEHLIRYIDQAKIRIYAAIYMFTDKNFAQALIRAKKERKVDVQMITDRTSVENKYGKVYLLIEQGIKTFKFQNGSKRGARFAPLMHNKFAIIDDKVWTGSFNWTISANKKNQENVIYTDEKKVLARFEAHFEKLKNRSKRNKKKKKQKPQVFSLWEFLSDLW